MRNWWATKQAAWGEALVFMTIGGIVAYLKPQIGIPILLVLLVLGTYLIWRAYKQEEKAQPYSASALHKINPTLQKMHSRLVELAEKEKNKHINWQKYLDFNKEISEGKLGIVFDKGKTLEDARTSSLKIEQFLQGEYNKKLVGGNVDKLDKDMWQISQLFDNRGYGLKQQKETDKKYLKLNQLLSEYRRSVTSPRLNELIRRHVLTSEYEANMLLAIHRDLKRKEKYQNSEYSIMDLLSLPSQADVGGVKRLAEEALSNIRTQIGECICELEKGIRNGNPIEEAK